MTEKNIDKTIAREIKAEQWLFAEAKKVRIHLFSIIALSLVIGLLVLFQARLLATASELVVINGGGASSVSSIVIKLIILAVIRSICIYIMENRSSSAAAKIKQGVRSKLYRKIQSHGAVGLLGHEAGSLIETITKGVDELETYFTRFLPQLAMAAILPLMFLLIILPSEWRSSLVLLFSAPFIPLFMILIGRGSEKLHRKQWSRLSKMAGYLLDLIQGLPDLIIFGAAKKEAEALAKVSKEYRSATMTVLRLAFLSAFTLEFFATVGTALVAVIIGFRLLFGHLSLGEGLFVLLIAPEFYLPLRNLGISYHARMQGVAAAERILPLLVMPIPEGYGGTLSAPTDPPDVLFENVSFRYGSNRGGVQNVNLKLPSGSITALIGESGAGKTTLARLLVGLARAESGRILINGNDLKNYDADSWRSRLAWVPQHPYFTNGTVRENLILGRPAATEEEINSALKAASADQFIYALSEGLETVLGDRGAGLSGGELKRLALARAYLSPATFIVLDEPTAGLDSENEKLICDALIKLAVGRTVLLISHREQTVSRAKRVVEMVNGSISSIVTADEYLVQSGDSE